MKIRFYPSKQLLSSNLMQNGDDEEGIYGFLEPDIQKEFKRAKSMVSLVQYIRVWVCSFSLFIQLPCALHISNRTAVIARNPAPTLAVAIRFADAHSICRAPSNVTVYSSSVKRFDRFAIAIMTLM